MKRIMYAALAIITFGTGACKKKEKEHFVINNVESETVNYRIYKTEADYYQCRNVFLAGDIGAKGKLEIPLSDLDMDNTYYFDLHNTDYSRSNWFGAKSSNPGFDSYYFMPSFFSNNQINIGHSSSVGWLVKNKKEQVWVAVNAFHNGNPAWSSLSENEKYFKLVFTKDFKLIKLVKDNAGTVQADTIPSYPYNSYNSLTNGDELFLYFASYDPIPDAKMNMDTISYRHFMASNWILVRE